MDPKTGLALAKVVVIATIVAVVYCLPMIIAVRHRHRRHKAITMLNVFLGWTVLGWLVALAWAWPERHHRRHGRHHENIVVGSGPSSTKIAGPRMT